MGSGNSRLISYDDALELLDLSQRNLIQRAWEQLVRESGPQVSDGTALEEVHVHRGHFNRSLLGGRFPPALEERIFLAFRSKNREVVTFRDFLCTMTVLMRRDADLRASFLFKLCDTQCSGSVERRDLLYVLNASDNEQGKQMKLQELQQLTDRLFEDGEPRGWTGEQPRVSIKPFQEWVRRFHEESVLLTWLMRSPLESLVRTPNTASDGSQQGPTNAHFDAIEIDALHDLHMRVRQSSPTGKVDQPAFQSLFCPPLSVELARNLFDAFDEHGDGEVDINEFICGLSAICRGSVEASLEFCLSVRTEPGGDDSYNRATLFSIVNSYIRLTGALQAVAGITEHLSDTRSSSLSTAGSPRASEAVPEEISLGRATSVPAIKNPNADSESEDELRRTSTAHPSTYKGEKEEMAMQLVEDLFVRFDKGEGERIAKEQVLEWLAESTKAQNFVKTIKRVTQASAGVRPAEPEEEKDVVEELLHQLSLKEPGAVFLVAQSWWSTWCAYSGSSDDGGKPTVREGPGPINNHTILDQTATAQVLRLRAGLVADRDFKVLSRATWATLHKWYGGGPEIRRQLLDTRASASSDMRSVVVQEDVPDILGESGEQDLPLELYPLFITIGTAGKGALPAWGRVTLQFSSTDRVEQVLHSAMTAFGDPPVARPNEHITQRVRLWSCHTPTIPVLLEDPSMTLADVKIVDGQYMELEDCLDSGEWSGESGRATRGQTAVALTNQGQARTIGIPGIRNLGNTCYMNSALQCLSRAEPLKEYFLSQKHFADLEGREADMPVTVAYTQLMRSMWSPEAASTGLCDTGILQEFKRTIGKFNDQFAGYNQQDVSEFLAFLIDGLHEEMNEIKIKPYVELDTDGKPNADLAQLAWDYHLSRERSVIGDAFSGQLKSTLRCSVCGNVSTSFDPFSTLPIELPLPETVAVEVELFWRRKPRTIYGLMVPRECKVSQLRQAIADSEEIGLAVHCQKLVQLTWREEAFQTIEIGDDRIVVANDRVRVYEVLPLERVGCYFTAMHRKQEPRPGQFLNPQVTTLFGTPIICALNNTDVSSDSDQELEDEEVDPTEDGECTDRGGDEGAEVAVPPPPVAPPVKDDSQYRWSPQSDLVRAIWDEVCTLVGMTPAAWNTPGFDHTLFFTVRCVCAGGHKCWTCDWTKMCTGCVVDANQARANWAHFNSSYPVNLVIDWRSDVVARFFDDGQWSRVVEHRSVARCRAEALCPTDIHHCLRGFTKVETLAGDEQPYCGKCKDFHPATKQIELWRLPPLLIVHLKRFAEDPRGRRYKVQSLVTFPITDLDLGEFVAEDCDSPLEKYDLFALSNHHGILGGGHYVAQGLFPETGQWYNFNDSAVTPMPDEELVSPASYILFYKRKDCDPAAFPVERGAPMHEPTEQEVERFNARQAAAAPWWKKYWKTQ